MVDLTISIVNTNNRDLLEKCLESIVEKTRRISYELYVVDNASTDGSADMVRTEFPQVYLLPNSERLGFSTNNNQVLRSAKSRYVILLNEDMVMLNDALDRMVAFMDDRPEAGAVGCKLLNSDGSIQRSCWTGFPSPRTLFIEIFYLSKLFPSWEWVQRFETTLLTSQQPLEVDHILGACMMVRSDTIERVGLLDESFFIFLEETDWCYRIKSDGWKVFWLPDGEILHYGQQSVSKQPERYLPMLYQNYCKFCRKHGSNQLEMAVIKSIIGLGTLLRAGLWAYRMRAGTPNSHAMMRGYLKAFRSLPSS